jgi:hypothetical protein
MFWAFRLSFVVDIMAIFLLGDFLAILYNHNDSCRYYKTTITIIIDDPS